MSEPGRPHGPDGNGERTRHRGGGITQGGGRAARLPEELRALGRTLDRPGGDEGETMAERVLQRMVAERWRSRWPCHGAPASGCGRCAGGPGSARRTLTAALCGLLTVLVPDPSGAGRGGGLGSTSAGSTCGTTRRRHLRREHERRAAPTRSPSPRPAGGRVRSARAECAGRPGRGVRDACAEGPLRDHPLLGRARPRRPSQRVRRPAGPSSARRWRVAGGRVDRADRADAQRVVVPAAPPPAVLDDVRGRLPPHPLPADGGAHLAVGPQRRATLRLEGVASKQRAREIAESSG